jgi:hypothetical protein
MFIHLIVFIIMDIPLSWTNICTVLNFITLPQRGNNRMKYKYGKDLKPGDIIEVWWQKHKETIKAVKTARSTIFGVIKYITFKDTPIEMTLWDNYIYILKGVS